jgi:hypothetical protein
MVRETIIETPGFFVPGYSIGQKDPTILTQIPATGSAAEPIQSYLINKTQFLVINFNIILTLLCKCFLTSTLQFNLCQSTYSRYCYIYTFNTDGINTAFNP